MRSTRQGLSAVNRMFVWLSCLAVVGGACHVYSDEPELAFGVFAEAGDEQIGKSLSGIINDGETKYSLATFGSLKDAVESDAQVLILLMSRTRMPYPEEIVRGLKRKKVIGVGYGAAQAFGQLGLEIHGRACAHFGNRLPNIRLQKSVLLGKTWEAKDITPYRGSPASDNFGMFIPQFSDMRRFVDVIAHIAHDDNYAPVVRQNNYVMIGLSAGPQSWSDNYRALVRDVAVALLKREKSPFATAQFLVLEPGTHKFALGKGRSTKEPSSERYYFTFTKPTRFSATLVHTGSNNMMMIFMGQKDRLHWTRMDAKNGEQLVIACDITADDLQRIGDDYWRLGVTNFDPDNVATCVLSVQYEVEKVEREETSSHRNQ